MSLSGRSKGYWDFFIGAPPAHGQFDPRGCCFRRLEDALAKASSTDALCVFHRFTTHQFSKIAREGPQSLLMTKPVAPGVAAVAGLGR